MSQRRAYIISYPRSGNTWVRLLLEHALGFETKTAYPGEGRIFLETDGNTHLTESPALELMKTHGKSLDGAHDVIYVLRDGRDATASYWHYSRDWEKMQSGRFSEFLQSLHSSGNWWADHVYAWLELDHPHRILVVRYEDLHKDQERELRRILDFLGLEPIRQFSDYAANLSFERLHARLHTFYRSGRIGAWRETFSPDDERFFRQHDLGLLTRYGYVRDEESPSAPIARRESPAIELRVEITPQPERRPMSLSFRPVFQEVELLADLPGKVFSQKTTLYEHILEPFCKIMDTQLQTGTILGKNDIFRKYTDIVRWPIRKLEYSFVLQHTLFVLEGMPHPRVLDAGCGVTPLPHLFAMMGADVDAVDFNEEVIETLKTERANELYGYPVNHQSMDLRRLTFPDSTFDIVTCVSVIEHLGNGDEGLVLAEIVRVLKPGGKAIVTTDVRGGDGESSRERARRFGEPFDWPALDHILAPYAQMLEGGLDQLKSLSVLQDKTIETFWTSHWNQQSSWQGNRGYVALGFVLSKPEKAVSLGRSHEASSHNEKAREAETSSSRVGANGTGDRLLQSQIQRTIELERELEQKEKVIQELHAEAECRREALEAVTADRDAWEARYRQLSTAYEAVSQNPLLQSQIQRTIELEHALEEKEQVIQGLHAEAERRLEALEAVTAKLDAVTQRSSSTNSEDLATSADQVAESQLARNPADSQSHATVAPVGPMVSIITPSYNQGRFIEETIRSVLTQNYPNIEYIVMDGGSTDNTLGILKKYEGQLTWISEADRGQSHAINKGFQMAKGDILAWLNSDDTYLPGAISKVVQHFQANPATMMVYGEGYLIDEQSRAKQRFPYTEAFNLWKLIYLWDNILQQTAFFRGRVFDHIDLLDENLHYGMDWDLWIRIGKKFRVDYIPEYLGNLREYQEAKTSSGGITRFNELVALMRRHGTRRFPPAYFTYGFGTYNKSIFGSLSDQYPRAYQVFVSKLRKLGHAVGSRMTRYLVDHSQGHYSDGWASPKAHFVLVNPGQASHVRLEGELINLRRGYRTSIRARLNGRPIGEPIAVVPGYFKLKWAIPQEMRSSDVLEVTLLSTRWHRPSLAGANTDRRRLSYRITRISAE